MSSTNNNREVAHFWFKLVDTGEKAMMRVPTNLCIANFIEFVKNQTYGSVFRIDRNLRIEIVEAGQELNGMRAEDAPAIQRDFNTTIRQRYNGVYEDKAFYIRYI